MPTTPVPSDPNAEPVPMPADVAFLRFWERNRNAVYLAIGLILAGILAKGAWDYMLVHKELAIKQEYAECSTAESYRAFAANHPGHLLAAMAELNVADDAYVAGHYGDAVANYEKAATDLPAGPFQDRAKMGQVMSQELSGKTADAETGLRLILNDTSRLKAIRCEAGYHLASLAQAAGRSAEVEKLAEQLMQIDPSNPFAERALALRAEMPVQAAAPAASAISLPLKH
jgi:tetratricopeptide (TPR) repeat protein